MKLAALLLLLLPGEKLSGQALLHVSGVSEPPARALLAVPTDAAPVEIEIKDGHLGRPLTVPSGAEASLRLLDVDGAPLLRPLKFRVPENGGRHLLVVSPGVPYGARVTLLPVDFTSHPRGAVAFLNLSDNTLRCWLGKTPIILEPGRFGLHPLAGDGRRLANHLVEYLGADGRWIHDSSTTLILTAGRRFIFTLGPGRAEDGPLLRHNVTDNAPDENAKPETPVSPPTPTPPPDPPAK